MHQNSKSNKNKRQQTVTQNKISEIQQQNNESDDAELREARAVAKLNELQGEIEAELLRLREFDKQVSAISITASEECQEPRKQPSMAEREKELNKESFLVRSNHDGSVEKVTVDQEFICGVCREPMQKPATLPCGHSFCAACLQRCAQLWGPRRCPECGEQYSNYPPINLPLEQKIFRLFKMGRQALNGELVRVLTSENRVPAFSFGIVESIADGFVSPDMTTLIQGGIDDPDLSSYLPTQIAVVDAGQRRWTGKINDLEIINIENYAIGTRPLRGSLVVHARNIKRAQDGRICCDLAIQEASGGKQLKWSGLEAVQNEQSVSRKTNAQQQRRNQAMAVRNNLQKKDIQELKAQQQQDNNVNNNEQTVSNRNKKGEAFTITFDTDDNNSQKTKKPYKKAPVKLPALKNAQQANFKQNQNEDQTTKTQAIKKQDDDNLVHQISNSNAQQDSQQPFTINKEKVVNDVQQKAEQPVTDTLSQSLNLQNLQETKENNSDDPNNSPTHHEILKIRQNMSLQFFLNPSTACTDHDIISQQPARDNPNISRKEYEELLSKNSKRVLASKFVYDPSTPKQQPPIYTPYYVANHEQVAIVVADEVISGMHTLMTTAQQRVDRPDLNQYMRLITDFQYLSKCPQYCCNGCKLLLRIPIILECGCQYCYNCVNELIKLSNIDQCLGCGQKLSKKPVDLETQTDRQLIMQMYSKIPTHSPMIDRGIPIRIIGTKKQGILLDDPDRVNVWVMTGPNQSSYLHQSQLEAIDLFHTRLALRAEQGLAFCDGQFFFLENIDSDQDGGTSWRIYGVNDYTGRIINNMEWFYYKCLRPVEDIREQIVLAKVEGMKLQQQDKENKIKKLKTDLIRKGKKVIQANQLLEKIKEQKEAEKKSKQQQLKNQKELDAKIRERQKRLGLVPYNNPDASKHPGNIMIYQNKQQEDTQPNNTVREHNILIKHGLQHKQPLIQLCYLHPKLNLLCSGCWNILKRPVDLPCGHVVCRTCACIYQASSKKCLLCHQSVGCILECNENVALKEQLFQIHERFTDRQFDVGTFVSSTKEPRVGIITQLKNENGVKKAVVSHAKGQKQICALKELVQLTIKEVVEKDLNVNSACMVNVGKFRGITGLVVDAVKDQQSLKCKHVRQQYGVSDDCLVLKIILETGCPGIFPLSVLRKIELEIERNDYEYYQKLKEDNEKVEEENLLKQIEDEVNAMTEDEKNDYLGVKNANTQSIQATVTRSIWEKK